MREWRFNFTEEFADTFGIAEILLRARTRSAAIRRVCHFVTGSYEQESLVLVESQITSEEVFDI